MRLHKSGVSAKLNLLVLFSVSACTILSGCATRRQVTREAALDYGQFTLRRLPADVDTGALKGKRIVIDPGHGGVFSGAVGPNNLREADVNLGVGLYLWGMLTRAGAEAYLTRMDDSNVYRGDDLDLKKDLQARAEFARSHDPDLFLSLHHNADVLPDARKNSLETYYRMSDSAASLDAARCIHRQLALSLRQLDNAILPGNFHVLRESPTTAVLGEPSYISHADNAFKLGLAPMQRIEAQAYFLGIAEYFSKGVPKIEDIEPGGTVSDSARPLLTAHVIADRGVAIDPASVKMLIDGRPVHATFDPESSQVRYLPPQRLNNGKHRARFSLRNINGNSARPAESEFEISMPPAYILLEANYYGLRPGSTDPIRLSALVFDADIVPVADGTPVKFEVSEGEVSPEIAFTRDGEAVAYFVPEKDDTIRVITVSARISDLKYHSRNILVRLDVPKFFVAALRDAETNLSIEGALAAVDGRPLGYSDHGGYLAVTDDGVAGSTITFSHPGYIPQEVELSSGSVQTVRLEPVAGGVLFGQRFALDPRFGGEEKGAIGPTGVRASDLNLLVAGYLAGFLRASGADVILTRESDETVSALRRVELAEGFGSQWFVSIDHGGPNPAPVAGLESSEEREPARRLGVMHYTTSAAGRKLAASIAHQLNERGITKDAAIEPGTEFVLTHTSSPAVIVLGSSPSEPGAEEKLRFPAIARTEAYAIYCGILENFGLDGECTGQIAARIVDEEGDGVAGAILTLDGALALETDSGGGFTFSRVMPGEHRIEAYANGRRIWAGEVSVGAAKIVSLEISLSGMGLISASEIM